jgi:hypothetical protein
MNILKGKTPSLVRKEIWVFLLTYDLLRTLMWSAGIQGGVQFSEPPLAKILVAIDFQLILVPFE